MERVQNLNDLQRLVAEELDENILLTASAGTGKTNTLSYRIGNIINSGRAKGEEILCLTYTNKACKEMQDRITSLVGEAGMDVTVRTLHSFCFEIIRGEIKENSDVSWDCTIFDETDAQLFLDEAMQELNSAYAENPGFRALDWPAQIYRNLVEDAKLKRVERNIFSGDDEADYQQAIDFIYNDETKKLTDKCWYKGQLLERIPMEYQLYGSKLLVAYDRKMKENHGLDFSDLIVKAYLLLKDEKVCSRWSSRYKYINIDEMQDINPMEYDLISRIFSNSCLLLCGDFFQTIFEWRGSNPDIVVKRYKEKYSPKLIVFLENYRSTQLLVDASFEALQEMFPQQAEELYPKGINAVSNLAGEKIELYRAANPTVQAGWIYKQLFDMLKNVSSDEQDKILKRSCILTRSNYYNKELSKAFKVVEQKYASKYGITIPFMLVEEFKFFRRQEIKDALAFVRLLINKYDVNSLKRIIKNFVPGIGRAAMEAIESDTYRKAGVKLTDFIDPLCQVYGEPYGLLEKQLYAGNVVVFDVEATGLDTEKDEIIQLAAIKLDSEGKVKERFVKYLRAGKKVGLSERVHHISDAKLIAEGEEPAKVLQEFCAFAKDMVIVGHNVGFDISILTSQLRRLNLPAAQFRGIYDTLDIFRRFYPNLPNHKLEFLGEFCHVSHKSTHDAFDDIMATAEILLYSLEKDIQPTAGQRREYISKHIVKFKQLSDELSQLRQQVNDNTIFLRDVIKTVLMKMGVVDFYKGVNSKNSEQISRLENLRELIRHARVFEKEVKSTREGVEGFLQLASLSNTEIDLKLEENPKIPILTVHQVKGSEFDYVFLADMIEGIFPNRTALQQGKLAEEKRLFYVALTRAKKKLYITYPLYTGSKKNNPSPYIKAIPEKYINVIQ